MPRPRKLPPLPTPIHYTVEMQSAALETVLQPLYQKIGSLEQALNASIEAQVQTQERLNQLLALLQRSLTDDDRPPF